MTSNTYTPTTEKPVKTLLTFNRKNIFMYTYKKGDFDRQKIRNFAQAYSNFLATKVDDGFFSVALHYQDIGVRGGRYTRVGQPVVLYDPSYKGGFIDGEDEDPEIIGFSLYFNVL